MRLALIGGLILFASSIAFATGVASAVKQPEKICEEALEHLIKCDAEGFDVLKQHLRRTGDPATDAALDTIGTSHGDDKRMAIFKGQMAAIKEYTKSLGEPIGFELVGVRQVGGALKRFTYLCKYQKGWIRWRFTFYQPERQWMLCSFMFDENEEALFAECGHDERPSELRTARESKIEQQ